ncbi:MAG: hypothetical protein ACRDKT_07780 [Actinomycetota bacterium]
MKLRVLAVVGVSVLGFVTPVRAAHPNIMCVDLGPDTLQGRSGDDIWERAIATIGTNDADHEEPFEEGCVVLEGDFGGTQFDFEVTGVADPDSSDTPQTPDLTCTIETGSNRCSVTLPESDGGTQSIRGWIDVDRSDLTVEADTNEGADEASAPGSFGEPDGTDVQEWEWSPAGPPPCGSDLICEQTITIQYRRWRGTFYGTVTRENAGCAPSRVTVWKVRRGDDDRIATTTADLDSWRIRTYDRQRGRFYAVLHRTWVNAPNSEPPRRDSCVRARSASIVVP